MLPLWIEIKTKDEPSVDIIEDWIIKCYHHIKMRLALKDGAKFSFYSYRNENKLMIIFYDLLLSPEDTNKLSQSLRWVVLEQMVRKESVEYISCLGEVRPIPDTSKVILLYIHNIEPKKYQIDAFKNDDDIERLFTSKPVILEKIKADISENDLRIPQKLLF